MFGIFGTKSRAAKAFDIAVLAFAITGGAQIVFWIDRTYPIDVHFRVIQTISVPPSGEFRYLNFFTRHKYCDTLVTRWFVGSDDVIRFIDPLPAAMPTEALNVRQISQARIKIPRDMPFGKSKSCFQSEWQCNPIQRMWPLKGPEVCLEFLVKAKPSPQSFMMVPTRMAMEGEP